MTRGYAQAGTPQQFTQAQGILGGIDTSRDSQYTAGRLGSQYAAGALGPSQYSASEFSAGYDPSVRTSGYQANVPTQTYQPIGFEQYLSLIHI